MLTSSCDNKILCRTYHSKMITRTQLRLINCVTQDYTYRYDKVSCSSHIKLLKLLRHTTTSRVAIDCLYYLTTLCLRAYIRSALQHSAIRIDNNTEDSGPTMWKRSLIGDNVHAAVINTCKHTQVKINIR